MNAPWYRVPTGFYATGEPSHYPFRIRGETIRLRFRPRTVVSYGTVEGTPVAWQVAPHRLPLGWALMIKPSCTDGATRLVGASCCATATRSANLCDNLTAFFHLDDLVLHPRHSYTYVWVLGHPLHFFCGEKFAMLMYDHVQSCSILTLHPVQQFAATGCEAPPFWNHKTGGRAGRRPFDSSCHSTWGPCGPGCYRLSYWMHLDRKGSHLFVYVFLFGLYVYMGAQPYSYHIAINISPKSV